MDRLTWLRAQCSDAKVDERLYEEFDRYDQDHSGKLSLAEVSEMLFDTMARDNIGVEVIKASSQASQLMRSMVGALAAEIVDEIDADGDQHVTWPELRSRWAHVKQRRDALARWILDYNLTFVSRCVSPAPRRSAGPATDRTRLQISRSMPTATPAWTSWRSRRRTSHRRACVHTECHGGSCACPL